MKKITSIILVCAILFAHCFTEGAYSAQLFKSRIKKDRVTNEQRFDYINYDWWESFNDEILADYIRKGLENNSDLKINMRLMLLTE